MNLPRWILRLLSGRRPAVLTGEITLPGIQNKVTIRRDNWGVPHIEASNDVDAYFGLGFVQGQDRAFQLEIILRVCRGTLSSLIGEKGLGVDRLSRRFGLRRTALKQVEILAPDVKAGLAAYAAGVNAGHTVGLTAVPHEIAILNGDLTDWEAADVLSFCKFQSLVMPSNWDVELARLKVLLSDGPEALKALDPATFPGETTASPDSHSRVVDALLHDLARFTEWVPRGGGSNNWVVNGSRSATGMPILGSDPHLGPTIPAPWYLAHIETPEWMVAGASFVGGPVFPIAHNGFACWGVTAGLTDQSDLFLETPESLQGCETVREVIEVKSADDVVEEIVITPRGPVISPLLEGVTEAISLRAVWLDPLPMRGLTDVPRARSFEQFRKGFAEWPFLPLNVVYADKTGTIAHQLVGQVPRRKQGMGTLPQWVTPESGWDGMVPFEEMPHTVNPPEGYFGTANNAPTQREGGPHVGVDFMDSYRRDTIHKELAKRSDWTREMFQQLQLNTDCPAWFEVKEIVLALPEANEKLAGVLAPLREWDGQLEADSAAAAVFSLFCAEMAVRVAKARAPKSWQVILGGNGKGPLGHSLFTDRRIAHLTRLLRAQPEGWFAHGWPQEMSDALIAVATWLEANAGPSAAYWAWGHLRVLHITHPILGSVRGVNRAFNLDPIPFGGDCNTIQQAGWRPLDPTSPTHNFPNLRTAFDVADLSNSRFALAGGQSGNPCSEHYEDQFPLWQQGEGIPIPTDRGEVLRVCKESLALHPGK